jgi:DNA-binding MarR family transcriptional regulator
LKHQRQGGFLIAKIHQFAGRIFNRMLREYGITELNTAQGRIMFVLWGNDGISISDLAARTGLGKSTLTSMLDRLEETGFLVRTPSPEDRRSILIFRTEQDKALQERYVRVSREMTRIFYQGFSEIEIDGFERALERILDNLTAEEGAP